MAKAVALRRAYAPFSDPAITDCARLLHGEGDGLPGVVVDLYAGHAVLKLYSAGLTPYRSMLLEALRQEVPGLRSVIGRDELSVASESKESFDPWDDDEKGKGKTKDKKVKTGNCPSCPWSPLW